MYFCTTRSFCLFVQLKDPEVLFQLTKGSNQTDETACSLNVFISVMSFIKYSNWLFVKIWAAACSLVVTPVVRDPWKEMPLH